MRARILTLNFSSRTCGFDDAALQQLMQQHELLELRDHLVEVDGRPRLVLIATWLQPTASTTLIAAAATPTAATPTAGTPTAGTPTAATPTAGTLKTAGDQAAPNTAGRNRKAAAPPVAKILQQLDDDQQTQFEQLRQWRLQTAVDEGVPPYVVLTNRQLVEIVKQRPSSRAALGKIDGVGDKKLERYAKTLLARLWPTEQPTSPTAEAPA